MGNKVNRLCSNCFSSTEEEPESQEMQYSLLQDNPRESSTAQSNSSFGSTSKDTEYLLRLIESASLTFYNHLKQPLQEEGMEEMVNKEGFRIFASDLPEGYFIKASWKMPFTAEEFLDFIQNTELRRTWDKNIERMEVISEPLPEIVVSYTKFKKLLVMSPRDCVLASKILKIHNGVLMVNTSCEHSDYPECKDPIRAKIDVGGYYIEPIEEDEEGNKSKVVNITIGNFGGSVPKAMVKKVTANSIPKHIKTIHAELKKHLTN